MGPYVRIILRYGVGAILGMEVGEMLTADPDVVTVATAIAAGAVGAVTEIAYRIAKWRGWRT